MLTLKTFICKNCGKCCKTYTVKLSDSDIKKIKKTGHKKKDFAEFDNFDPKTGKYSLKKINNQCLFLTERNNKYYCKIYNNRPEICRKYPFNETNSIENCEPDVFKKRGT
jgi:uncharacterized protein